MDSQVEQTAREMFATELEGDSPTDARAVRKRMYLGCEAAAVRAIAKALALPKVESETIDLRDSVIFLSDRIDELDWSGGMEQLEREWHGHVEPALTRLRGLVRAATLNTGGTHE